MSQQATKNVSQVSMVMASSRASRQLAARHAERERRRAPRSSERARQYLTLQP
jgi:hypothetical protein